jgi:hypothetical protein
VSRQVYPQDREYFQVVTAITVGDAVKIMGHVDTLEAFPNVLSGTFTVNFGERKELWQWILKEMIMIF